VATWPIGLTRTSRDGGQAIAADLADRDAETFEDFIAFHPDLLRSDLLGEPHWKLA
jgi:hypothetical protein